MCRRDRLGAAQLLKEREAELKGTVRLIFQPAEENFQGAYQVIEAGGLDGVSAIIGYHNNCLLYTSRCV